MLKFWSLNVLLALAITIPIIVWAGPFPFYSIAFIYIVSMLIVSAVSGFVKRKITSDKTKRKLPGNNNAAILVVCACITMVTACKLKVSNDKSLVTCRDFLSGGNSPRCDVGAYGYLLFTRSVAGENKSLDKIKFVADLFRTGFETRQSISANGIRPANLMLMYWMVKDTLRPGTDLPAAQMVAGYDYARAKIILSKLTKPAATGPVLVAWSKPCNTDPASSEALVFDMSGFDNEDIRRAFNIWIERVSNDPSHWSNGFKLEQFRSEFRNFVNNNGEILYKLILSKDKVTTVAT